MSLTEIVRKLADKDHTVVASMAAYVERITESKDSRIMADIRSLGGVPAAVDLLGHPIPDIHHSAANILWNIAYRQPNEDNNLAIKNAGGIPAVVRLLRSTSDEDIKEICTGTLWNLSSDERLKIPILEDSMTVLVRTVLIPESGWNRHRENDVKTRNAPLSDTFTNATGCLRNVSSAGSEARKKMRECEGLVDSLLYVIHSISESKSHELLDSRAVENTMCIIQNLSYHVSLEIFNREASAATPRRKENQDLSFGCFSFGKKSNRDRHKPSNEDLTAQEARTRKEPPSGKSLLWQPDVCRPYFYLLTECSNIETLEATAATVQNLTAADAKWTADIRTSVRKAKGLPILVELLKVDNNGVVQSVSKALHNLCFDPRNKELVGKYGLRDLIMCLPGGAGKPIQHKPDVVVAVIHCIHRLVLHDIENARELRNLNGVDKLINMSATWGKFSVAEIAAASQVLITLWSFKKLRPLFKKDGWNSKYFHPHVHSQSQARPGINVEDECTKCNTCLSQKDSIEQEDVFELPQYQRISGVGRLTDDEDTCTVMTYDTTTTETGLHDSEYYTESVTTATSVYADEVHVLKHENHDYKYQMRHLRKELEKVSYHNVELMQQVSDLERRTNKYHVQYP